VSVNEYNTVAAAVNGLARRGFVANFEFTGDRLLELDSRRAYAAEELVIVEHHRAEGASDPGDMAIVYAIETVDGVRGILVEAFGPYAGPGFGTFLRKVKVREAV
jgi:hypothetical protein